MCDFENYKLIGEICLVGEIDFGYCFMFDFGE